MEKQIKKIKGHIDKLIEEEKAEKEKNEIHLINCQDLLQQLNAINAAIKINYDLIKKLNSDNNEEQKIDEKTQQEINQLLQMLEQNENIINDYQDKIETLKNDNSDKGKQDIEFYQNLINSKKNDILKIQERIDLLKINKEDNNNQNNCCKEISTKLNNLVEIEKDKTTKIDAIYKWHKKLQEKDIENQLNNIEKNIEDLQNKKDNIIPTEIKEKISTIEYINNQIIDNKKIINELEQQLEREPSNQSLKTKIKNLQEENNKLNNDDDETEKINSKLKDIEEKLEQESKAKKELEQQLKALKLDSNNDSKICEEKVKQLLDEVDTKNKIIEEFEKEIENLKKNKNENKLCDKGATINCWTSVPQIRTGIQSITGDNNNTYCVGRSNVLFKVKKNKEVEKIGNIDANASAIQYNGLDDIFVGTYKGTIYKYNIKEETFTQVNQVHNFITKMETDNNHNIYFGTWEPGSNKNQVGNGKVYKITTESNDLIEIKGTTGTIWSLAVDKNNNIYVGTAQALFKSNGQSDFTKCLEKIPYQNANIHSIQAIKIDKDENIWIGTREGQSIGNIYKCKKGENQFTKIAKNNNGEILTLAIDSKQTIYVGTWTASGTGNILKYDDKANDFKLVSNIPTNFGSIEHIFINEEDEIYIGTRIGNDNSNDGRLYKMKEICL